jgi:hypothetical protein
MPTVPRLNDAPVQEAATPNVRFSADAPLESFGGGKGVEAVFETGQKILGGVADIVEEQRKQADALAVANFKDKAIREKNRLFWGDEANGFYGAVSKRGQEALAAKGEYLKAFSDFSTKEYEGLANDRQKQMAAQVMREQEYDLSGNLNRHVAGEVEKFRRAVTDSSLNTLQDDATKNWVVPGKISKSIEDQRKAILEYAGTANIPLEQQNEFIKRQVKEAESKTHSKVINAMVNSKEATVAQVYFDSVKGTMTSDDVEKTERIVKEGTTRLMGQKYEDELIRKFGSDETAALREARDIENPEHRDEAVRRLKVRYAEDKEAQRNSAEARLKSAVAYAQQSKERPAPDVWNTMTPQEQQTVDEVIQGKFVVTDLNRLYKIKQMVHTPEFKEMNLTLEMNRIAPSDLKELMDLQTGLRGGSSGAKSLADGIRNDQEIINTKLKKAGFNPASKNKTILDTVDVIRKSIDDEVVREQKKTGERITNEELEKIASFAVKKHIIERGAFSILDKEEYGYKLKPGQIILDVPKEERVKITDTLKRNGKSVNERTILDLYNRKTQKNAD